MSFTVQLWQPEAADEPLLAALFNVFQVLRPHLDLHEFSQRVCRQAAEGYRIAYIEEDGQVLAVAGFRVVHFLAWGRVLYLDDLVTDPGQKRRGLAGALMDWLKQHAAVQGCAELHLDSGYQRHDAHRLYLNQGMVMNCHHFAVPVKA